MNLTDLQKQFIEADNEALLETKVVAAFTRLSASWFNNKASSGGGIPYTKLMNKRLYKKADVLAWLKENCQKVKSTSEYKELRNA